MSLRKTLAAVTIIIVLLAAAISTAMVVLTTAMHDTTATATTSVENVRLAEETEIDLLLHERARDPLVRSNLESAMRRRLTTAEQFVSTEEERRVLVDAQKHVDAHIANSALAPAERSRSQEAAYAALEALVDANIRQSKEALVSAARWNALANFIGLGAGLLLFLVAGGVIVWLNTRAFAPVLSLAGTMMQFGNGDRHARAREEGPRELREMSQRFNEMANALAAQRNLQLAFLGGVAHDLRNPLSVLKMSVALLRSDQLLPPEPLLRQTLQRIDRQVTRLERLLADFLEMAKLEAGTLELRLDLLDARKFVQETVDLFEGASEDHRIEVSLPDEPALMRGDYLRMEQVVTNLLSNAIKYSPPATVIKVAVETRGDEVIVRVSDQGDGISEEDRDLVFEPFRRARRTGAAVPGAGLGLFVVRRIVEAHRGRIDVESTLGAGSTFRVHLPLSHPRSPRLDAAEPRVVTH